MGAIITPDARLRVPPPFEVTASINHEQYHGISVEHYPSQVKSAVELVVSTPVIAEGGAG